MSTSTYPNKLNITTANIAGPCNEKCHVSENLLPFQATVVNEASQEIVVVPSSRMNGTQLSISNSNYTFLEMVIACPSNNVYNGNLVDAEAAMIFVGQSSMCIIYVPMSNTGGGSNTAATHTISEIVTAVVNEASDQNDSTTMPEIDLTSLLPIKHPFYFAQYEEGESITAIFTPLSHGVFLQESTLSSLQSLIKTDTAANNTAPTIKLFVNERGISKMNQDGGSLENGSDAYMICEPTNVSREMTNQEKPKPPNSESKLMKEFLDLAKKYHFKDVILGVFAIMLLILFSKGFVAFQNYMKEGDVATAQQQPQQR